MGFLDKLKKSGKDLKGKAEDLADEHGDKIKGGIDKAADVAEKKAGKHSAKIEKVTEKAKDAVDDLAKEGGDPPTRHSP